MKNLVLIVVLIFNIIVFGQNNMYDDFDNDVVSNQHDYDDDNDGITDSVEFCLNRINYNFDTTLTNTVYFDAFVNTEIHYSTGINFLNYSEFKIIDSNSFIDISLNSYRRFYLTPPKYYYTSSFDNTNSVFEINAPNQNFIIEDPFGSISVLFSNNLGYLIFKILNNNSYLFGGSSWRIYTSNYTDKFSLTKLSDSSNSLLYISLDCFSDYDSDGQPNHLDNDSDNDGCGDAFEGSSNSNKSSNFQFTNNIGLNGLSDSVETYPESNILNFNHTYNFFALNNISSGNLCNYYLYDSIIEDNNFHYCFENIDSVVSLDQNIIVINDTCIIFTPILNYYGFDTLNFIIYNDTGYYYNKILLKILPSRDTLYDTLNFGDTSIFCDIKKNYYNTNVVFTTIHSTVGDIFYYSYIDDCITYVANQYGVHICSTYFQKSNKTNEIDSIVYIYYVIQDTIFNNYTVNECDTNFYLNNNFSDTLFLPGDYIIKYINPAHKLHIDTLHLTFDKIDTIFKDFELCVGDTIFEGNNFFINNGIYIVNYTTSLACDSTIKLNLKYYNNYDSIIEIISCDSYYWSQTGLSYTNTGSYSDSLFNVNGCDSIITLELTINYTTYSTETKSIVDSFTWSQNNITYYNTGIYKDTILNSKNCDSIITLDLTINYTSYSTFTAIDCDSFTWNQNNITYNNSGKYKDTILNIAGFDSIITLDLTINFTTYSSQIISSCDSYKWNYNNQMYYNTGIYKDTILNSKNCDSIITLELTINYTTYSTETKSIVDSFTWSQSNITYYISGIYKDTILNSKNCDSIITLDLTINYTTYSTFTAIDCDSFTWNQNNITYYNSGIYKDTILNIAGFDSIITLDLTINFTTYSSQIISSCDSYKWNYNNQMYYNTGIYKDTILNSKNCDSIITLDLTIDYTTYSTETKSIVDSFTWSQNNITYYISGIYKDTILNSKNCDSIITLDLTINYTTYSTFTAIDCDSFTWNQNNITYYNSGKYKDTILNIAGFDSIITLDLTINFTTYSSQIISSCDSYKWNYNNQMYYNTGIYKDTILNSKNCDSVITLDLTINYTTYSTLTAIDCDSFTWGQNNITYYISGIYKDTILNSKNCDSIITLDLTINYTTYSTFTAIDCDSFTWNQNNITYYNSGIYYDTILNSKNCDSVLILELYIKHTKINKIKDSICGNQQYIFKDAIIYESGIYYDTLQSFINDCDSIVELDLYIRPNFLTKIDTVNCKGQKINIGNITTEIEGEYIDTLKSVNFCDSLLKVNIKNENLTIKVIENDFNCIRNMASVQIEVENNQSFNKIFWYKDNDLFDSNKFIVDNLIEGKYSYEYISDKNCKYTGNVFIDKFNSPIADFEQLHLDNFDYNIKYINQSNDGIIYEWQFGNDSILSENYINEHTISYRKSGEFFTKLITRNKYCVDSIIKSIKIENIDNCIYVPNSITPNGDNINDILKIEVCNINELSVFEIEIYNRWGNKVYENHKINNFEYPDFNVIYNTNNVYLVKIKYVLNEIENEILSHLIILE